MSSHFMAYSMQMHISLQQNPEGVLESRLQSELDHEQHEHSKLKLQLSSSKGVTTDNSSRTVSHACRDA